MSTDKFFILNNNLSCLFQFKGKIMLDKILPKKMFNKTKVESVKSPFVGKIPYGRNNVAYYLLNTDTGRYMHQTGLISVQYEMYQKIKPNVTFVIKFFNTEQNDKDVKDLLDMHNTDPYYYGKRPYPFNQSDRCRYLISSMVNPEERKNYVLHKKFNLSNMLFFNILNNPDLGYHLIVKQFILDFFNLTELNNQEFNNFNELHEILSKINTCETNDNSNANKLLDFINKYKDVLFFEKDNCTIFSVEQLENNYAEIKLNDVLMTQITEDMSRIFWGTDVMSLYYDDNYTYFFNNDSGDELFNSFIQELIKITAQYLNNRQLPRYENNVLYCLYNCNNKNFIQSLLLDEKGWINRHIDILSIHYIDNNPDMSHLKNIIHEHILPRNTERKITTDVSGQKQTTERLNLFLGSTTSFIMYPLLNINLLNDYVKQIEYIYNELLYGIHKHDKYYIQYMLNDFKTENLCYQNLIENQPNLTLGTMSCFDLSGFGLIQYKMNHYKDLY